MRVPREPAPQLVRIAGTEPSRSSVGSSVRTRASTSSRHRCLTTKPPSSSSSSGSRNSSALVVVVVVQRLLDAANGGGGGGGGIGRREAELAEVHVDVVSDGGHVAVAQAGVLTALGLCADADAGDRVQDLADAVQLVDGLGGLAGGLQRLDEARQPAEVLLVRRLDDVAEEDDDGREGDVDDVPGLKEPLDQSIGSVRARRPRVSKKKTHHRMKPALAATLSPAMSRYLW